MRFQVGPPQFWRLGIPNIIRSEARRIITRLLHPASPPSGAAASVGSSAETDADRKQPHELDCTLNCTCDTSVVPLAKATHTVHEPGPSRTTETTPSRKEAVHGLSAVTPETLVGSVVRTVTPTNDVAEQLSHPLAGHLHPAQPATDATSIAMPKSIFFIPDHNKPHHAKSILKAFPAVGG